MKQEQKSSILSCEFCDNPIEVNYCDYLNLECCEHIEGICKNCYEQNLVYEYDICGKILCPKCVEVCENCQKSLCKENAVLVNGEYQCEECASKIPQVPINKVIEFFDSNLNELANFMRKVDDYTLLRYFIQEKTQDDLKAVLTHLIEFFTDQDIQDLLKAIFHCLSPHRNELDFSKMIDIIPELDLDENIYKEKIINLWKLS